MFHPCKITVVKRMLNSDLIETFAADPDRLPICDKVKEGQVFRLHHPFELPEGICAFAWADLRPFILTIAAGGRFDMMKKPVSTLAICADPFRPVIFNIETVGMESGASCREIVPGMGRDNK